MASVVSGKPAAAANVGPADSVLIERTRRGDASAFDALATRYMRGAFSVAYRLLGHREDAEDLVQEAFVAVLENLDRYDGTRPFKPWFFRILVNRGLSARKSRSRRQMEEIPANVPASNPSPAAAAETAELRRHLGAALAELPERDRTIIKLFELEGFNSAEIGEILGIAPGTVRWQLHQARKTLRAALEPCRESLA